MVGNLTDSRVIPNKKKHSINIEINMLYCFIRVYTYTSALHATYANPSQR